MSPELQTQLRLGSVTYKDDIRPYNTRLYALVITIGITTSLTLNLGHLYFKAN